MTLTDQPTSCWHPCARQGSCLRWRCQRISLSFSNRYRLRLDSERRRLPQRFDPTDQQRLWSCHQVSGCHPSKKHWQPTCTSELSQSRSPTINILTAMFTAQSGLSRTKTWQRRSVVRTSVFSPMDLPWPVLNPSLTGDHLVGEPSAMG